MRNTLEMFSTSIDIYRAISLFSIFQVINRACEVKGVAVISFYVANLVIIVCHETEVLCHIQTFCFFVMDRSIGSIDILSYKQYGTKII